MSYDTLVAAGLEDVEFIGRSFHQGLFKHWMDPAYQVRADDVEVMDEVLNGMSVAACSNVLHIPLFFHRHARELLKWGPNTPWNDLKLSNGLLWASDSKYGLLQASRSLMADDVSFSFLHNVAGLHWVLVQLIL
ncbi:hypothetical protein MPER_14911, partial [Moniliophthora perniciosa FA553]